MPIHVLFVEDEDDLRSVVVKALTSQGFQVTPASNGDEALVLLRGSAKFAVVVTDFNMPDSADGLEVAAEAAVAQPQARVMLASGLQRSQLPPLPEKVRFLPKPYPSDSLLRRSTKTWAARRGRIPCAAWRSPLVHLPTSARLLTRNIKRSIAVAFNASPSPRTLKPAQSPSATSLSSLTSTGNQRIGQ